MDATRLSFFADLLIAQMRRRGWNAVRLAKEMEISRQTSYRWIKPHSTADLPGDEVLPRLAELLGRPVQDLRNAKAAIKAAAKGVDLAEAQTALAQAEALGLSADQERACDLIARGDFTGLIRLACQMIDEQRHHAA